MWRSVRKRPTTERRIEGNGFCLVGYGGECDLGVLDTVVRREKGEGRMEEVIFVHSPQRSNGTRGSIIGTINKV